MLCCSGEEHYVVIMYGDYCSCLITWSILARLISRGFVWDTLWGPMINTQFAKHNNPRSGGDCKFIMTGKNAERRDGRCCGSEVRGKVDFVGVCACVRF